MAPAYSPIITVMTNAAIKASKGLLRDFGEVDQLQVSQKGAANFVTKADLRAEKSIIMELQKARPAFGFLAEESGEIRGEDPEHRWIIDPLDGTSNFIHAVPYFCISLALEKKLKDGSTTILAGVIYDPIHNEMFTAEEHKGAFVNGRRLVVSARDRLDMAMVSAGTYAGSGNGIPVVTNIKHAVNGGVGAMRSTGSAALDLAYVAAGRYDACWYLSVKPWDVAAGILMVKEAGGIISDTGGNPVSHDSPNVLAGSKTLHPVVTKLLAV